MFFPGMKIKREQELCLEGLVLKRKDVLGVWKKPPIPASVETV